MLVSSAESTAFDLVRFADACGGWSAVVTVLKELAEVLAPDALQGVAYGRKTPEIQRLGCLLDQAGHTGVADSLLRVLGSRRHRPVQLASESSALDSSPVLPWRVVPNVGVEVDL